MITVSFACGHRIAYDDKVESSPICQCGETRVRRVDAPAPRFAGFCSGPHAEMRALDPPRTRFDGTTDVTHG